VRKLPIYLALAIALTAVVELLWHTPLQRGGEAPPMPSEVLVVDARTGVPLAEAAVARLSGYDGTDVGDALPTTDGRSVREVGQPRLVRAEAPGYLSRVVALGPDEFLTVPLSRADDQTVSVRLAGEVDMGGGHYRQGLTAAPALAGPADQAGHDRLLSSVAPLLSDADVTVATLASPLVDDPYVTGPRPAGYHPDKPTVLAASPATAVALSRAGVDVVSLGTSHAYDALQPGLDSTVAALDAAGIAHFGAGATPEEAWAPAYVEVRGRRVAFLGCTSIGGAGYDIHFVADRTQGGAAYCEVDLLRQAVSAARAAADDVVVLISGGPEGVPATPEARRGDRHVGALAQVAAEAGASLVAGSHGHLARGIANLGDVPWVKATGDLVSDSRDWETMRSSVVRVALGGAGVTSLAVDPVALVSMRPVPVVGTLADSIARTMAGVPTGPMTLAEGTTYWPPVGGEVTEARTGDAGSIARIGSAWTLAGEQPLSAGRDLLWGTGSMEDLDTDPAATGSTMWALGRYVTTSLEAGCHGVQGLRLRRGPLSAKDVVISPQYRQAVTAGTHLTLAANVRLASAGASLEVRWYRSLNPDKRSSGSESVAIEPHRLNGPCSPVRLDLVVPEGMVAAQPYVRLSPRHDVNLAAELRVDDVRLIAWSEPGLAGRQLDTVEFPDSGTALVTRVEAAG
jgi:Bacterial capsule synthesis protein PGA_cap